MSHELETLTGMYYYFVYYTIVIFVPGAHVDAVRQCQQQQKVYFVQKLTKYGKKGKKLLWIVFPFILDFRLFALMFVTYKQLTLI